jgi:hypothetical protein
VGTTDQKCLTLDEWKRIGHLVLDYRLLLDWAASAEVLYATAQGQEQLTRAESAVHASRVESALSREAVAHEQAQAMTVQRDEEKSRGRRFAVLSAVFGGAVIVLGGIVVGMAATR